MRRVLRDDLLGYLDGTLFGRPARGRDSARMSRRRDHTPSHRSLMILSGGGRGLLRGILSLVLQTRCSSRRGENQRRVRWPRREGWGYCYRSAWESLMVDMGALTPNARVSEIAGRHALTGTPVWFLFTSRCINQPRVSPLGSCPSMGVPGSAWEGGRIPLLSVRLWRFPRPLRRGLQRHPEDAASKRPLTHAPGSLEQIVQCPPEGIRPIARRSEGLPNPSRIGAPACVTPLAVHHGGGSGLWA